MQRICPRIALGGDGRTASDFPDADHRCHASAPPLEVEPAHQAAVCLTDAYAGCPRYVAWLDSRRDALSAAGPVVSEYASTRLVLEHDHRGVAPLLLRPVRGRPGLQIMALLVGAIAAAVLLLAAVWGDAIGAPAGEDGAALTEAIAGAPDEEAAVASPAPAAVLPLSSPTPAARPTSVPDGLAPTAPAEQVPSAGTVYIVQPGDTLAVIAAAHGTSMSAIATANGLQDADLIVVGESLIIP